MKNKNVMLGIMLVLGVGAFWADNAQATNYYVRLDGGNSTQCTGTTNAPYPGSGSAQACAFNHPRYALGWGCTNTGNSCANGGVMQGGDTLYIDGDDPTNGGAQAQYEIGYDDTGNGLTPGCSSFWPYDCTLGNLPAGPSLSARTSIIGTGAHKPQLWGTQRVWQVLNADNNHIWLQNLEITDHDACAYNDPASGCNYGGPYPYGQWAVDGIYLGGDDVNVTDVYVHGVGRYGMYSDNFGSTDFTRFYLIGNGYGGVSTGTSATISGTLTWNQPIIEWNGCVEAYPVTSIDNPSDYSQCFGQNSGGYGDGLAFGNTGHGNAGNWTIIGPGSISFNTQDGLDTLHGTGNGFIQIDKMRFEGNAGDQVKMNALNSSLTNSVVIGDCGWWLGAPQSYSGFSSGDICRALGDVIIFNVTNGGTTQIYNNTIVSNGNIALESDDANSTGCNGSTKINVNNNIVLGGYTWIDDTSWNGSGGNSLTTYTYNDGNDGDGSGTCGSLSWNEDYNIVYGTKNNNQGCLGAHDKCSTNPGFAGTIPMGAAGGAANTYYQGNAGASLVSLAGSSSAAIASGAAGLTYWNNGNDYHNMTRTSPPSIGGLEKSSCAADSYGCFYNSDCCTGSCSNFVCGGKAPTPQPVVAITSPGNGSSFTAGANVTVSANASEVNGNISNISIYNGTALLGSISASTYNYVASNIAAGAYVFTAKATDANGVSMTSNPVTVTVAPAPVLPSLPAAAITAPVSGSIFTAGSNITFAAIASETNGTISNMALYNGAGVQLASSSTSPLNFVYTNVLAGSYTFTVQATDVNGVSVASSPVSITVNPLPVVPSPPVVALTSPGNGSSFTAGSNIQMSAAASENNGSISKVVFYNGSNMLGTATSSSPYTYTWNNVAAGSYALTSVATDSTGVSATSKVMNITVTAPINLPPINPPVSNAAVVTIISPVNNASYTVPAGIVLTARASESGAAIARVDYYAGSIYLGEATSSPFSVAWNSAQAGTYSVTARSTDNNGVQFFSAPVNITVNPHTPPTVALTNPANNASYASSANIALTANASVTGGSITKVDFYANGWMYLGTVYSSPYRLAWNNVPSGTYSLTVKATDSYGWSTTSTAVKITVGKSSHTAKSQARH